MSLDDKQYRIWNDSEERPDAPDQSDAFSEYSAAEEFAENEMDEWDHTIHVAVEDTKTGVIRVYTVERHVEYSAMLNLGRSKTVGQP